MNSPDDIPTDRSRRSFIRNAALGATAVTLSLPAFASPVAAAEQLQTYVTPKVINLDAEGIFTVHLHPGEIIGPSMIREVRAGSEALLPAVQKEGAQPTDQDIIAALNNGIAPIGEIVTPTMVQYEFQIEDLNVSPNDDFVVLVGRASTETGDVYFFGVADVRYLVAPMG